MDIPGFVQTSLTRLASYFNSSVAAPANPGGFDGDGHVVNFPLALRDVATVGQYVAEAADRFTDAVSAIEAGPVTSVNGMSGTVVLPDVPKVLPPIVTTPAQGSTASLTAGALLVAVDRLTSLYGEAQKTIRFQVASANTFAAAAIVHDTGVLTQTAVSASIADAQMKFTAGTTYYVRAIQTDAKDVSSGWSAPVSFTFPRLPNAPVMSVPANGATNQGAQNGAITLTASAYSHPAGVAQASRRFELSKDNFATIITINGTVGQASATITSPRDVLTAGSNYKVRPVDVDANGGVATGAATTFTTVAAFRPNPGDPWAGGHFVKQSTVSGVTYDLVSAPKSGGDFSTRTWGGNQDTGATSRTNSVGNTNAASANESAGTAVKDVANLVLNGFDDWVILATDEQTAAFAVMDPDGTNTPAVWKVGGAEALENTTYWTSTESGSSTAYTTGAYNATQDEYSKAAQQRARAFRYVPV